MTEKKEIKIRSFCRKWYSFLIPYAVLNVVFFISNNQAISNIYKSFVFFYPSDFSFDGANFAFFLWLLGTPLFLLSFLVAVAYALGLEIAASFIFKLLYTRSLVKLEDIEKLVKYVKIALLCVAFANLAGVLFWLDFWRVLLYALLYFPVPIIAYDFIHEKIKIRGYRHFQHQ